MRIVIIGRGANGGGLAGLLTSAGHEVEAFGRDGGDATGADVVIVATPSDAIAPALAEVKGLSGQVTIDATNALAGRDERFESLAHQVKEIVGGPTAKAFNVNFAALYPKVAEQRVPPSNLYAAEDEAEETVVKLIEDVGYAPVKLGDLGQARALEDQAALAFAIYEAGMGEFFYRYAPPGEL